MSRLVVAQLLDEYVFVDGEAHGQILCITAKSQQRFAYDSVICNMAWNKFISDGRVSFKLVISPSAMCRGTRPNSLASVKMDCEYLIPFSSHSCIIDRRSLSRNVCGVCASKRFSRKMH